MIREFISENNFKNEDIVKVLSYTSITVQNECNEK